MARSSRALVLGALVFSLSACQASIPDWLSDPFDSNSSEDTETQAEGEESQPTAALAEDETGQQDQATPGSASPPIALDPLAADWSDEAGWHRIAVLPGIQRRPQALSASRRSPVVAVLGGRGRRVTLVRRGLEPRSVMLPIDIDAADVAVDDEESLKLVVTSVRTNTLVRIALEEATAPAVLAREELSVGRASLETTPDGSVEVLDALQRPDLGAPAVRGLIAPSGRRYRAVRRDSMAAIIGNGKGGHRMAMLAKIPKAEAVRIIGLDPAGTAEDDGLDRGWLAAWTGNSGPDRGLHFVRFDSDGRVLLTTPAPPMEGTPPEGFDLRAAVLGSKEIVVALPSQAGLELWRHVPAPDGQRFEIKLTPGNEGSSPSK